MQYWLPFLVWGLFMILVVFVISCCFGETKLRESIIGLVSIPEILCWIVFCVGMR